MKYYYIETRTPGQKSQPQAIQFEVNKQWRYQVSSWWTARRIVRQLRKTNPKRQYRIAMKRVWKFNKV